jgi:PAS domain S-box-containing protein
VTTKDDDDKLPRSVAQQDANSILIARQRAEQRSEFYLAEAQRLAHIGSWAFNPSGFFEYWSPELFQIYGLDPSKGVPTLIEYLARVHPKERDFVAATIEKMLLQRSGCDVKKRILRPDGELRYIRWVGVPVFDDGVFNSFVGTAMDVTEQEHLTQKLRRRQAYAAEAQGLSHTGSFSWRVSTGEILWSEETFRIFEYERTTVPTAELVLERVHPEDLALVKQTKGRASQYGKDFDFEHRLLMPDGRVKYLRVLARALQDSSGDLEFVGAVMDITATNQAKEALRKSEEQWRDVFENNPTMYFMVDAAGKVLAVNPFGAGQLGYRADELIGQPVFGVFYEPDREAIQTSVAICLEQIGRTQSWEARKVRKDGEVLWVRETAKAVPRMDGPIVLIACEDITEQKRASEALRHAQEDLARITRVTTMGELTASLAHELNQPIAAAVTNANTCLRWLTREHPDLREAREAASRIVQDVMRATDIISRIRLLFEKGTPERELVDVNEIIREMIVLLRSEATRYATSVRTELAADLPRVMGDRVQLQQVIMNLMINGIDAMKDVDGMREQIIRSQPAGDEQVLVSVSDTGVGLPSDQTDQIFNAFFTTKRHGTGMGLSISRSIIESHGGRLWAVDNSSRGASFCFTLPAQTRGK